jgi:DNA-binding XRE family transcriptional regulator
MGTKKSGVMEWIDRQMADDPEMRQRVETLLNEIAIEQSIVALREERGLSQAQVAKLLGVTQPAIAKIESGRVRNLELRTLARLAAALGGRIKVEIVKDPKWKVSTRRQPGKRKLAKTA